jgi:hypothetical protein
MEQQLDGRALARARLARLRSRVGSVRRRGVVFAAGTFALTWVLIFVRMVSGHDPVLGSGASRAQAESAPSQQGQTGSTRGRRTTKRLVQVPLASGGYGYAIVRVPAGAGDSSSTAGGGDSSSTATAPAPLVSRTS